MRAPGKPRGVPARATSGTGAGTHPPSSTHDDGVTSSGPTAPVAVPSPTMGTMRIQAAVRVRPLVEAECVTSVDEDSPSSSSPGSAHEVIRVVTAAGRLTRPLESAYALEVLQPSPSNATSMAGGTAASTRGPASAKAYAFDYCAGPSTTQADLFMMLDVAGRCEAALSGEVVTVFCFGQTGSGKTYTLSGRTVAAAAESDDDHPPLVEEDGLQYQAVAYVARRLKEMRHATKKKHKTRKDAVGSAKADSVGGSAPPTASPSSATVVAKCSYVELYQEFLYDLLQPDSTEVVRCRWSTAAQSFYVEGSLLVECRSEEDFALVLREGQRNRQRGSHALNHDSSRSHVVFTIFFDVCDGAEGEAEKDALGASLQHRRSPLGNAGTVGGHTYGRLVFVDLAGSERLKKSQSSSSAETGSINKSLFTLGHVLELLSTTSEKSTAKAPFIPYRSSVLTQLLMQSLDGHGRTLMVACVSPSALHLEESLRTLHYAQRARHIRTTPVVHVDAATQQRMALEERVRELTQENAMLRRALGLPRAGPLSEADVLARVTGGVAAAPVASTKETPSRGRATSSPVPLLPPAQKAGPPAMPGCAAPGRHARRPKQLSPPSPPLPSSSSEDGEETEPLRPQPSPPPATSEEGVPTVNIMTLLDALPDTRSMM